MWRWLVCGHVAGAEWSLHTGQRGAAEVLYFLLGHLADVGHQ